MVNGKNKREVTSSEDDKRDDLKEEVEPKSAKTWGDPIVEFY